MGRPIEVNMLSGPETVQRRPGRNYRRGTPGRRGGKYGRRGGSRARIIAPVGGLLAVGLAVGVVVATSHSGSKPGFHPAAASSQTAGVSSSAVNPNCDLIVPANPLSAKGLATPYQLTGPDGETPAASGCQMINSINLGGFVQATILDPRTGALSVYNPLVITQGTTPAIAPVVPKLPKHAVVTIDFGFNGTDLFLVGATPDALGQGNCTDGMPGSPFGQVSFCNGTNFFNTAARLQSQGKLAVPLTGMSHSMIASAGELGTGRQCPTVRNFEVVDQDPSDNVTSKYLLDPVTGQTAQDNAANAARMSGAKVLVNGSDNALIDDFIDPALGCNPFEAPDLANHGAPTTSQALDELLAMRNQPKTAALVPENDGMVMGVGQSFDEAKADMYRAELGQAPVNSQTDQSSSPAMFCQNLVNIQTAFIAANQSVLAAAPSPIPTQGDTLYTFLASRLSASFTNLNCKNFGLTNPVTLVNNGAGAATQATLNTAQQTAGF